MRRNKRVGLGLIPQMIQMSQRAMHSMKARYNGAKVKAITDDKVILNKKRMNTTTEKICTATFRVPLDLFTKEIGQPTIGMIV